MDLPGGDSHPNNWRLRLGEQVAALYARHPAVVAAMVTGSVSRGHADRFSDVEVLTCWTAPPAEAERAAIVSQVSPEYRLGPAQDDGWWEDVFAGRAANGVASTGALVEIVGMPAGVIERTVDDVVVRFGTDLDDQSLVHAVMHAKVVAGAELVRGWAQRCSPYPRELAVAMVHRYGQIDNFSNWKKLLARGSNLMLIHEWFSTVEQRVLLVLQALNGRYHYKFKWLQRVLDELDIAPATLAEDLHLIHTRPVEDAAEILRNLVEQVYDVVEQHLPEVKIERLREIFRWERHEWEAPPPLG